MIKSRKFPVTTNALASAGGGLRCVLVVLMGEVDRHSYNDSKSKKGTRGWLGSTKAAAAYHVDPRG
jgi:hypothetical protein